MRTFRFLLGLGQHLVPEKPAQEARRLEVDLAADDALELVPLSRHLEEPDRHAWRVLDQHVDVALGLEVAAQDGPEERQLDDAVAPAERGDRVVVHVDAARSPLFGGLPEHSLRCPAVDPRIDEESHLVDEPLGIVGVDRLPLAQVGASELEDAEAEVFGFESLQSTEVPGRAVLQLTTDSFEPLLSDVRDGRERRLGAGKRLGQLDRDEPPVATVVMVLGKYGVSRDATAREEVEH